MLPAIFAKNIRKEFRLYRKPRDWLVKKLTFAKIDNSRRIVALDDISVTVEKGKTFGIIGPNGAGKTTLLKVLTGMMTPTKGEISINGKVAGFLELGLGFHPDFTGRQNIKLNCAILGLSRSETDKLTDEIIAFSELKEAIDDPVRTYSAGMYMRLGFSIATAIKPDILVVDEVLSVGDEYFMGKCLDYLNRFKAQGGTLVLVSHDLSLIRHLCDETALLVKGKIISQGAPDDVADAYLETVYETAVTGMKPFTSDGATIFEGVRRGSGEIRITGFELIDDKGNQSNILETDRPFKLRMFCQVYQPIAKPLFGFNIFRHDGVLLVSTNHTLGEETKVNAKLEKGQSLTVTFNCEKLPLLKGKYSLGLSVFHGDMPMPMPVDEVLGAAKFEVVQGKRREKGALLLEGGWQIE